MKRIAIFIDSENRLTANGIHEWAKTGDAIVFKYHHYTDREAPKHPLNPRASPRVA
jgi:hypothetical protein